MYWDKRQCCIRVIYCEYCLISLFQYGKGMLHTFKGDAGSVADLIPVDFPVNAIIAAAWYTGVQHLHRSQCSQQNGRTTHNNHVTDLSSVNKMTPKTPPINCSRCKRNGTTNPHNMQIYQVKTLRSTFVSLMYSLVLIFPSRWADCMILSNHTVFYSNNSLPFIIPG